MPVLQHSLMPRRAFLTGAAAGWSLAAANAAKANTAPIGNDRAVRDQVMAESSRLWPLHLMTQDMPVEEAAAYCRGTLDPVIFHDFLGGLRDWGEPMQQAIVSGSDALPRSAIDVLINKTRRIAEYFDAISGDLDPVRLKNLKPVIEDFSQATLLRGLQTLKRMSSAEPGERPIAQSYLAFSGQLQPAQLQTARNRAFKSFALQVGTYDPDSVPALNTLLMRISGRDAAMVSFYEDYQASMMRVEQTTARLVGMGTEKGQAMAEELDLALTESVKIVTDAKEFAAKSNGEPAIVAMRRNIAYRKPGIR